MGTYEEHNDQSGKIAALQYFIDYYSLIGDWKKIENKSNEAKKILNSLPNDDPVLRNKLEWTPWVYVWSGRFVEAESIIQDAINFCRDKKDVHTLLVFLYSLSLTLGVQGKYKDCLNSINNLIAELKDNEKHTKAVTLGYRGYIYILQGNLQRANDDLTESLTSKQGMNDDLGISEIYNWLGELNEVKASQLEGDEKIKSFKLAQSYYTDSLEQNKNFRHYFECGALTGLVRVNYSLGNYSDIQDKLQSAEKLSREYEYNDHMASLRLYQGHMAFENNSFDDALGFYKESLIYALRYNRFLLDEILSFRSRRKIPLLQAIIPTCLQRDVKGKRMLEELCKWWREGINETIQSQSETISPIREGIPLIDAEYEARDREVGDGSLQRMVVIQIEESF